MSPPENSPDTDRDDALRDTAAQWVVRQDRALSAAEERELAAWLGADPRHAAALARARASWKKFRAIGAAARRMPAEETTARPRAPWAALGGLAAAAAIAALLWIGGGRETPRANDAAAANPPATASAKLDLSPTLQTFPDGSTARLKAGAEIATAFSPRERRVTILRGEVFFTVAKDAARPFYVAAGPVTVRAVGTAFAVRHDAHAVDVLVTEGTVRVTPPPSPAAEPAPPGPLVEAGHRAVVAREVAPQRPAVVVSAVTPEEIARALAWREPMLELAGATLGEVAAEFSRRSGRRLEIGDPALAAVRIGGRFPTDDAEGFLRALEEIYDVKAERRADGATVLRRAK